MTYRVYRKLLTMWADKASRYVDKDFFGMQLLKETKVGKIKKVLVNMSEQQLDNWDGVVAAVDKEFQWTEAGEGHIRWKEYIHHQKQGKIRDGMEDFLMEHDNRHQRMHSLLFKPLKCWRCGELKTTRGAALSTAGLVSVDATTTALR